MGFSGFGVVAALVVVVLMVAMADATPPGIANNPSHATCKIKKYKNCYNLVHVCPKFCPDQCTVECASCKPICGPGDGSPPPEDGPSPSPATPSPSPPSETYYSPPPPVVVTPSPPASTPTKPHSPPPVSPTPAIPSPPPTVTPPTSPFPPPPTTYTHPPPSPTPSVPRSPPASPPRPPPIGNGGQPPPPNYPSSSPPPTTYIPPPPSPTPSGPRTPPASPPRPPPIGNAGQPPPPNYPSPSPPPTPSETPSPPTTYTPPPPSLIPSGPRSPPASPPRPAPIGNSGQPPPPNPSTPDYPSPSPPPTPSKTPSPPTTYTHPPPSPTPSRPRSPPDSPPRPAPIGNSGQPPPPYPSTPDYPSPSPSPTPETPSPPTTYTHPPPSPTPSGRSPPPSSANEAIKRVRCKNVNYPQCYNMIHTCPSACPSGCEVDCVTCKPVCNCDRPGAVCQDPRFIGGDGITFYFHGKKDRDFCLVSDPNLHINAHLIGKRNQNLKRDFTWVQSLGILFDNHQLFIGAQETAAWDDSVNRLALALNGQSIALPEAEGSQWQYPTTDNSSIFIVKLAPTNHVMVEAKGLFRITVKVVPITEEDSWIHNYGITKENSFAHLDVGFKFFSLSSKVSGVLGQTYSPEYTSRINVKATMPVMGREEEFATSSLFAVDCTVSRFGDDDGGSGEEAW